MLEKKIKKSTFHKFFCSQTVLPEWNQQPQNFIFSCFSCFPHIAVSNLCPGQPDRWLIWKTRAQPVAVGMLQQIGCLFHLQAKEKGIYGMIWLKKNNCFLWQSHLDSAWAVAWLVLFTPRQFKQTGCPGLSGCLKFPAYFSCVFGSLPRNRFTELRVENSPLVVSPGSPTTAFPGTVSAAPVQMKYL